MCGVKLNCAACHAGAKLNIIHQSGVTCRGARPPDGPTAPFMVYVVLCASVCRCLDVPLLLRNVNSTALTTARIRNIITLPHRRCVGTSRNMRPTCKRQLNFSLSDPACTFANAISEERCALGWHVFNNIGSTDATFFADETLREIFVRMLLLTKIVTRAVLETN